MSLNLLVAIEQEDHDNVVRPMILTRFTRGITHSANVSRGDVVDFDGLHCTIGGIQHKYSLGDKAPVSDVYGNFHRSLSDTEIGLLQSYGFRDLTGESSNPT